MSKGAISIDTLGRLVASSSVVCRQESSYLITTTFTIFNKKLWEENSIELGSFEEDSTNNRYLFYPSHDLEEDREKGFGKSLTCRERGKIEKKVRVVGANYTDDASLKHTDTLITVDRDAFGRR